MPRIRYIPGLLSLALMLPLALWFLKAERAFVPQRCISLNFPSIDPRKFEFDPSLYERKWVSLNCPGDIEESWNTLQVFKGAIEPFVASGDTVNGLRLTFEGQTKYETVMQAVEICRRDSVKNYWLDATGLSVINVPPPPPPPDTSKEKVFFVGGLVCGYDYNPVVPEISAWEKFQTTWLKPVSAEARIYWPVILVFSALAFVSLRKARAMKPT